jgi:hypothetical protein
MNPLGLVFAAASMLCVTNAANASMDAATFLKTYDSATPADQKILKAIAASTEDGMGWANTALIEQRHELALYCVPQQVALSGDQLIDMLRRYVDQHQSFSKFPFGMVMYYALRDGFPCPPQSK